MKAAVVREYGTVEVEDIDVPEPGPRDVLVRVQASGICRSDITALKGAVPVPLPLVLGHEGAGVVERVGTAVTSVEPGDHVVMTITNGCGLCFQCQRGARGLCELNAPRGLAGTMGDGSVKLSKAGEPVHHYLFQSSLAEYAVISETCAVNIRRDVPFETAALLACGFSTGYGAVTRKAQLGPGENALVIGLGGVGLAVVMSARTAGASTVIGVDRSEAACALARELGATHTIVGAPDTDLAAEVRSLVARGVDHAFDVVGTSETINAAFNSLRNGGQAVAIGLADLGAAATVPVFSLIYEKTLTGVTNGSIRPHLDIPAALDLHMNGQLPIDGLITRRYKIDDISTALHELGSGGGRSVVLF